MGKLVLTMSMSLDGFMEGAHRELDWQMVDDEVHDDFNARLRTVGAFVNGRVTYELMAEFWPTADQDPDSSRPMVEFARLWRETPKIVYSRREWEPGWKTTVIHDVIPTEVQALKERDGRDLALGGANLASTFMRLGLLDECRIYVHPVVIGGGRPLFAPSDTRTSMRLLDTKTFRNGVQMLHYALT